MTKAKHPGVGKGMGGGRPKRSDAERIGSVRLSAEAARRLREHCETSGLSLGDAIGELVMQGLPCGTEEGLGKAAATDAAQAQPRPSWWLGKAAPKTFH